MPDNHSHEPLPDEAAPRKVSRILVVDDEEDTRELLAAGLGQDGFECLKARDADQAVEVLDDEEVDLVLLDIQDAR
jgi:DNA-binding response OmpR family regulator